MTTATNSLKNDDPSYEPSFERVAPPTEPLSLRSAKRALQREEISRARRVSGLRLAFGEATKTLVRRFLKTGRIEPQKSKGRAPKGRRLLKTNLGKKISSTKVALWVFDQHKHGGLRLMEAYKQTARDLHLTPKQVSDAFKDHRKELELHEFLFTLE